MSKYTLPTRQNVQNEKLYVCIVGGGTGHREQGKGPKILRSHNGESILEHQVKTILGAFPEAHISVTTGFQSDRILKNRPRIGVIENQLFEDTGPLEEMRLFLNTVFPSRLLIIDGAIYFNHLAIKITDYSSVLEYDNSDDKDISIQSSGDNLEWLCFGRDKKWAGIAYLDGMALESFKKTVKRENNKLSIHEGINKVLADNIPIKVVRNAQAEIYKL